MKRYNETLKTVLTEGVICPTRGIPTVAVFGAMDIHDCSEFHPLVTTKFQGIKNQTTEFVWMMRGLFNNRWLVERKCNIWNDWDLEQIPEAECVEMLAIAGIHVDPKVVDFDTIKKLLLSIDKPVTTGNLGPVYGSVMTDWKTTDGGSINQLRGLVDDLKSKPFSRRHIVSLWNPELLPDEILKEGETMEELHVRNIKNGKEVLPPCHMMFQVNVRSNPLFKLLLGHAIPSMKDYSDVQAAKRLHVESDSKIPFHEWVSSVIKDEESYIKLVSSIRDTTPSSDWDLEHFRALYRERHLDLLFFMRSNDKPLGEPYNKSHYGELLAALAHVCGYKRGNLIHVTGNSHIYLNQLDGVETVLNNKPKAEPKLIIKDRGQRYLDEFEIEDFSLEGYEHCGKVSFGEVNV